MSQMTALTGNQFGAMQAMGRANCSNSTPKLAFGNSPFGNDQLSLGAIGQPAPGMSADPYGRSPAMVAASLNDTRAVLTAVNANPAQTLSETDTKGQTVLDYLMNHENTIGLQAALESANAAGVNLPEILNKPDKDGYTRLAWAAERGNLEACTTYLQYGAKPVIPEAGLNSPHALADQMGWTQITALLNQPPSQSGPAAAIAS